MVERFNIYGFPAITADTEGDWCRYSEANTKYMALEARITELQAVVDAIKDIHRQAVSMGGGHSAETRKLTSALGKAIKESD